MQLKKILAAMAAASLALSLAACDKSGAIEGGAASPAHDDGSENAAVTAAPIIYDNNAADTMYSLGETAVNFTAADIDYDPGGHDYNADLAGELMAAMHSSIESWTSEPAFLESYIAGDAGSISIGGREAGDVMAAADAIKRALETGVVINAEKLPAGVYVLDLDSQGSGDGDVRARLAGDIVDGGCFRFDLDLSYVDIGD